MDGSADLRPRTRGGVLVMWFTFAFLLGLGIYVVAYLENPIGLVFLALAAISHRSL